VFIWQCCSLSGGIPALCSFCGLAVEAFSKRIEKIGAIYEMRRYAVTHETALPCVDLTETVRGLRTSAGCLCLMAGDFRKQISSDHEKR